MKKTILSLYLSASFIYMGDVQASDQPLLEEVPVSILAAAINDLDTISIEAARSGWYQTLVDFLEGYSLTTPTKDDYRSLATLVQLFRDQDDFKGMISTLGWVERLYVQMNENGNPLPLVNLLPRLEKDLRFSFHEEIVKCREGMWRDMMEAEMKAFRDKYPKKDGQAGVAGSLFKKDHPRDQLFIRMCMNGLADALIRLVATYSQDLPGEDQFGALLDEDFLADELAVRCALLESVGSAFVIHNISAQNKSPVPLANLLRLSSIDLAKALDDQIAIRQGNILKDLKEKQKGGLQALMDKKVAGAPDADAKIDISTIGADNDIMPGVPGTLSFAVDATPLNAVLNENDNNNSQGNSASTAQTAGSSEPMGEVENKGSADGNPTADAGAAGTVVTESKDGSASGDEESTENRAGEVADAASGSADAGVGKSKGGLLRKLKEFTQKKKKEADQEK